MRLGILILAAAAVVASGQEVVDPPSRVGRIRSVEGSVSFRPADATEWSAATMNYPLTTGDKLWTGENSYAMLHIGATAIHLSPQAAFKLSRLSDLAAQMSLTQGSVYVRIPVLSSGETVEVDTPNGAVSLLSAGSYRVDVDAGHQATFVTVRAGEALIVAGGRSYKIEPGRMLHLVAEQESADPEDATPPDDWEKACAAEDQKSELYLEASESYVPLDMEGAEDLAQYGVWSSDETFGAVWCPAGMDADWAPYRNGHWAFVRPWGWTWIDDARWGFAPFHFGRWVFTDGRWLWVPGGRDTRPVYSPALVVFLSGPRMKVQQTGRLAGWTALAPGETYRPPYRASDRYLKRINGPNSSEPARYRNIDRAIVVPQDTLTGGRPIPAAAARMPRGLATGAGAVSLADLPLARPNPATRVAPPPAAAFSRPVVSHEVQRAVRPAEPATPVVPVVRPQGGAVERQPRVAPAPVADQQQVDQQRVLQHRAEQQTAEQQRGEQQLADQARQEQQRQEQQRAEQARQEQQRQEQQRVEQARQEQQRQEQQRAEQARQEQQRQVQQRAEQARQEQQRQEQQRAEQARQEQHRQEQQRAEQARQEQQRAEQARQEQQRQEQQRQEQQRAEQSRQEQQRAEQARQEQQRQEQQRAEQQRQEQQRQEQQRAEAQKRADDARKKQ